MKHLKNFKLNELMSINKEGDLVDEHGTQKIIEIFKKLKIEDYKTIIKYFSQDWDYPEMMEELMQELFDNLPESEKDNF
jgi:hypothetical protein